jgi:hypothetical protein
MVVVLTRPCVADGTFYSVVRIERNCLRDLKIQYTPQYRIKHGLSEETSVCDGVDRADSIIVSPKYET